ncbi:MAG: ABC transporter permease [Gemmatimonadota bacterium]|nr:ABC transporter permease [Gemmatimonadota bacterium]MDQ8166946.1 ABC transporter permease [Gemmatimonadota bacterium]MDQ8171278.1 ABC transporter permease [Gemmatimonadota bacterium]
MLMILRLALTSLRSRLLTTSLTVASIALSVTLLVGIENVRAGVRDSFAGTIRGVDLIVGARGGTLQVLLSAVFGIGSPSGSVKLSTMERWQAHPAVKWVVPYSLGDSHRGFRVVGTTPEFYERYRFRKDGRIVFVSGRAAVADTEVVIGSDAAEKLGYTIGSPVVVVHGLRDIGTSSHEAHPFHVVGILGRTFTPIDRSVYVTLGGIEAMHEPEAAGGIAGSSMASAEVAGGRVSGGRGQGGTAQPQAARNSDKAAAIIAANKKRAAAMAPPPGTPMVMPGAEPPPGTPMVMPGASPPPGTPLVMPGAEPPPSALPEVKAAAVEQKAATKQLVAEPAAGEPAHDHGDDQITAFFVGTKNRFEALMLQREMNTDLEEPLTAVIPGVALGELWQNIGSAEVGLRVIAIFAVAIGLTGMLVALYSSLEARRREMAILRAVGAGPRMIISLLVLESGLLALLGCLIGVATVYLGLFLAQGPIEQRFGLHLALHPLRSTEWTYLAVVMGAGLVIGFVPAWKAYRTSLVDGLSPRA